MYGKIRTTIYGDTYYGMCNCPLSAPSHSGSYSSIKEQMTNRWKIFMDKEFKKVYDIPKYKYVSFMFMKCS